MHLLSEELLLWSWRSRNLGNTTEQARWLMARRNISEEIALDIVDDDLVEHELYSKSRAGVYRAVLKHFTEATVQPPSAFPWPVDMQPLEKSAYIVLEREGHGGAVGAEFSGSQCPGGGHGGAKDGDS